MSFVFSSSTIFPGSRITQFEVTLRSRRNALSIPNFTSGHCKISHDLPFTTQNRRALSKERPSRTLKFTAIECTNTNNELYTEDDEISYDWGDQELGDVDMDSPWEGAVVYKRDASTSHVEYCTTLERLGLGKLSTELSKSRASIMGLRVTKAVKDFPHGTPVLISVDVTRKRQKLRLDGILRTVISLTCNRCGEAAAECIYSNFSLLLTEEPFEEPDDLNIGSMFGESKSRASGTSKDDYDDNDEESIDMDDWLYFPPEEKEVDISKHIRDMVHVEITINVQCDPMCKGLCFKCGSNLNTSSCKCSNREEAKQRDYGPLGGLKQKLQQT